VLVVEDVLLGLVVLSGKRNTCAMMTCSVRKKAPKFSLKFISCWYPMDS
jgi:hypothetical protein